MECPIDKTELKMSDRQGVEIDYCPKCRGVWLDRGELDKIIDRMEDDVKGSKDIPSASSLKTEELYPPQKHYGKHGRRKGLLGELFDF